LIRSVTLIIEDTRARNNTNRPITKITGMKLLINKGV